MNDRLLDGCIAGVLGGIVMNATNLLAHYGLHLKAFHHYDVAGQVLYGHLPQTTPEGLFALLTHLLWTGGLGVIYAYLAPWVTTRHRLFRGAAFGAGLWLMTTALSYLTKLPPATTVTWEATAINLVSAVLLGLTIALVIDGLGGRAWQREPEKDS